MNRRGQGCPRHKTAQRRNRSVAMPVQKPELSIEKRRRKTNGVFMDDGPYAKQVTPQNRGAHM